MKKIVITLITFILIAPAASWGTIMVYLDPQESVITPGDIFDVNIMADFGDLDVISWGLDLEFDASMLSLNTTEIGIDWYTQYSNDGDGLGGMVGLGPSVTGNSVRLATLSFEANVSFSGDLDLALSFDDDGFEGVYLSGELGAYNDIQLMGGTASAVPEPASMLLMGLGLFGLAGACRRKNNLL